MIDAGWSDFTFAAKECVKSCGIQEINSRKSEINSLFVTKQNPNKSLVCLSVRTAFDLFFRVKKFPSGSEVIMTAVNIPSMTEIVLHHGLKIVPWDFDVRTFTPDADKLNDLINDKTVAVVFAHLFGKWCRNLRPFLNVTRSRNVCFIEDCAETFLGFDYLGDPSSDLVMFSFGIIKYYTCFGGALVKIRDENLLTLMSNEYDTDPIVSNREYLEKIFKYRLVATGLNVPLVARFCVPLFRRIGVDHKQGAINLLRGFPKDELIRKIRRRPSSALLAVMLKRLSSVDDGQFWLTKEKGDFVEQALAEIGIAVPGCDVDSRNYWLFPIIVVGFLFLCFFLFLSKFVFKFFAFCI